MFDVVFCPIIFHSSGHSPEDLPERFECGEHAFYRNVRWESRHQTRLNQSAQQPYDAQVRVILAALDNQRGC